MSSFTPLAANFSDSVTKSSIGVDLCPPLIRGIAQKEHFLSHKPSENIFLSTDNGSLGIKGNLFEAINLVFSIEELQSKTMYVCGPPMMMETVHKFSLENNIECYLALETVMACGIGICQGCTLEINVTSKTEHSYRNKYELVCMDGPIYNAKKVKTCLL